MGPPPPLVGREQELRQVAELVAGGHPTVLVLEVEPSSDRHRPGAVTTSHLLTGHLLTGPDVCL